MSLNEAKNILFSHTPITEILYTYSTIDYYEFTGRAGGDTLCFRVYRDGTVTER